MKTIIFIITIISLTFSVMAKEPDSKHSKITKVLDHAILQQYTGKNIKIAGIIIPNISIKDAMLFVANNYIQQDVNLVTGSKVLTKNDQILAHIYSLNDKWLQGQLLEQGLAFAYPTADNNLFSDKMLKKEHIARQNDNGLWQKYKVKNHIHIVQNIALYKNKFHIVTGKVHAVKRMQGKFFINFAEDWKSDFSVVIRNKNINKFQDVMLDDLIGKTISVRGWVESYNGPLIEIYEPGHLEVLSVN